MCCPNRGYELSGSAGTVGYHRSLLLSLAAARRSSLDLTRRRRDDGLSVKPDTDSFDDLANTPDLVLEHAIKFLRTAAFWLHSDDRKLLDYVGLLHNCARLRGNFLNDFSRCARTGINPHIRREVKPRNQLG